MSCFFFFNDTATTEIYTLSLHDALPICTIVDGNDFLKDRREDYLERATKDAETADRKSTRLNSSHLVISYAVFCLKKKKTSWAMVAHSVSAPLQQSPSSRST